MSNYNTIVYNPIRFILININSITNNCQINYINRKLICKNFLY